MRQCSIWLVSGRHFAICEHGVKHHSIVQRLCVAACFNLCDCKAGLTADRDVIKTYAPVAV